MTLFCVLVLTGCIEEAPTGPENDVTENALVFGDRDVEQTRGMLKRAAAAPEGSSDRAYLYSAATLSRATATVRTWKQSADCVFTGFSFSSALLSSDTRLMSAFHTVLGRDPNQNLVVHFETQSPNHFSNNLPLPVSIYSGEFLLDGQFNSHFTPETLTFRSNVREENPMLANRLFQLGLDTWSDPGASSERQAIREGWTAVPDIIGMGEGGFAANTQFNQGFVTNPNGTYSGDDVVLLKISSNPGLLDYASRLTTGLFNVDRPAVFFGHVEYAGFLDNQAQLSTNRSYLLHAAPWTEDWGARVPLISLPGVFGKQRSVGIKGCDWGGSTSVDFTKSNIIEVSHDARAGSSGSGLVSPSDARQERTPLMRELVGIGVYSGALASDSTWLGGNTDHVTAPNEKFANHITMLSASGARLSGRDNSVGDPSDPQPLITGNPPVCLVEDEDANGVRYCREWISTPELPVGALPLPEKFDGSIDEEDPGIFPRKILCKLNGKNSIMVGMHGGTALARQDIKIPTDKLVEGGGGIGTLMGICAPYSASSYTANWRFLRVMGSQLPRELDTLGGQWGYGSFDSYMARVYEERTEGGRTYVRPPSTKMCPPNYVMYGVALGADTDKYYTGVEKLYCTRTRGSGPATIDVLLSDRAGNYTLDGSEFSLTQYIGDAHPNRILPFRCNVDQVMVGFITDHDQQGRLKSFSPRCMSAP